MNHKLEELSLRMPTSSRVNGQLLVIVFAQFAGTSLWFAGNAILPELQPLLNAPGLTSWITSSVQIGFITGTNLPYRTLILSVSLFAISGGVLLSSADFVTDTFGLPTGYAGLFWPYVGVIYALGFLCQS